MTPAVSDEADLDYLANYESSQGYLRFLDHWTVNSQPDPLPFWEIAEDWQWDREERRDRALDNVCGLAPYHGRRWFWTGCAKGNDKSTGVGRRCVFCLAFSKKPVQIYVCSGKLEQAAIVTTAMKAEVELNPWLKNKVTVHDHGAEGASGAKLTVMPMKAATGQGIFPDYLIADEVTHWEHDEGAKFWNFVTASVVKRPGCLFEVLTNAGFKGSWQWKAREEAMTQPNLWDFFEQPERTRLATWMDDEKIEAMGRSMFPGERDRLLYNRWIDPGEESGYITLEEAEACIDSTLTERTQGDPTLRYYAVVDYGSGVGERNRDRTALCILHSVPGTDRIVVDRLDCWMHPTKPIPIDIQDGDPLARSVEGWIEMVRKNFRLAALVLDKYQMESLAQKYERRNLRVVRYDHQAGKKNMAMAQVLRELVRNRRVTWSANAGRLSGVEDDTFAKELSKLVLKEMSYGYRFDHTSGHHDDRCFVAGTLISTGRGQVPIEEVTTDDVVMTRFGWRSVAACGPTGVHDTVELLTAGGKSLVGTPDHPIFTENGWVELGSLTGCDRLASWEQKSSQLWKPWDTVDELIAGIPDRSDEAIGCTSSATTSGRHRFDTFIGTSGLTPTDRFLTDSRFTTGTTIRSTTISRTWNASRNENTTDGTGRVIGSSESNGFRPKRGNRVLLLPLSDCEIGTQRPVRERDFPPTHERVGRVANQLISPALCVGNSTRHSNRGRRNTVPTPVVSETSTSETSTRSGGPVLPVGETSSPTSTVSLRLVADGVLRLTSSGRREVYNLSVAEIPEYFANGILVHNCVAVGMGMTTAIEEIRPAGSAGPKGVQQPPLVQEESGLPKVRKDWMEKRGLFGVNRY